MVEAIRNISRRAVRNGSSGRHGRYDNLCPARGMRRELTALGRSQLRPAVRGANIAIIVRTLLIAYPISRDYVIAAGQSRRRLKAVSTPFVCANIPMLLNALWLQRCPLFFELVAVISTTDERDAPPAQLTLVD
jgi:hypothetical protein